MSDEPPAPASPAAPAAETETSAAGAMWDAIVLGIERPIERFLATFKWPLIAGLLVAAATLWLARLLTDQESIQIGRVAEAKSQQIRVAMVHAIAVRERALGDFADRWEHRPPDAEAWSVEAALLLQRDLQFRAIAWLDDTLGTRQTRPTTARILGAPLDVIDDPVRLHIASNLDAADRVTTSRSYLLLDSHRQVLVRAWVDGPGAARHAIVAVMKPGDLFDEVLGPEIKEGWAISVYEGPYLLFGPQWAHSGPEAQWTRETEAQGGEWGLTVRSWPSEELAAVMRSPGPRAVWIIGLALALLAALGVRRIETLSRRAA